MLVDAHCHLDEIPQYLPQKDILPVICGHSHSSNLKIIQIAKKHRLPFVLGISPQAAQKEDLSSLDEWMETIRKNKPCAIGEIGLDYHYDHSPRDVQRATLERQIAIAKRTGLPVIIHNRESTDDLVAILESEASHGVRGILHSFTESYEVAARLVDRGFYISFSGILTFRSADNLRDAARRLPHDRILIETDTPYLAPVPHRGQRNEPAWVLRVADTLAGLWSISLEDVAAITTGNFESVFGVRLAD